VPVGGEHVSRFVAEDAGTYWYHSHQVSHEQVRQGLLGALVVDPPDAGRRGGARAAARLRRHVDGERAGSATSEVDVPAGTPVRVRVGQHRQRRGRGLGAGPYRVVAVDGTDVHEPTEVRDQVVRLTAGARVDVEVVAPARVQLGRSTSVVVGSGAGRWTVRAASSTCWRTAVRRRSASTPTPPTASSSTPSGAGPASSTGGPGCGGR
jgi:FtsP/CotA-like multicopper oxidase with cupredoxin domain